MISPRSGLYVRFLSLALAEGRVFIKIIADMFDLFAFALKIIGNGAAQADGR